MYRLIKVSTCTNTQCHEGYTGSGTTKQECFICHKKGTIQVDMGDAGRFINDVKSASTMLKKAKYELSCVSEMRTGEAKPLIYRSRKTLVEALKELGV